MSQVGSYRGIKYARRRLCDVFPWLGKTLYWFTLDEETGEYTGDHFRKLEEMKKYIDESFMFQQE